MSRLSELCDEALSFSWKEKEPISIKQCVAIGKIIKAAKVMEEALIVINYYSSNFPIHIVDLPGNAISQVEKILND